VCVCVERLCVCLRVTSSRYLRPNLSLSPHVSLCVCERALSFAEDLVFLLRLRPFLHVQVDGKRLKVELTSRFFLKWNSLRVSFFMYRLKWNSLRVFFSCTG